jgi:hypothetical protein
MNMKISKNASIALAVAAMLASAPVFAQVTFSATLQGYSTAIPESTVITYCGDLDGCKVRIAMYNWDGNKRTASRETLLHYNASTRNWRDLSGDTQGTNWGGGTQHIESAWSCYFTDGQYINFANVGDINADFAVLSWTEYNAGACRVTLID